MSETRDEKTYMVEIDIGAEWPQQIPFIRIPVKAFSADEALLKVREEHPDGYAYDVFDGPEDA